MPKLSWESGGGGGGTDWMQTDSAAQQKWVQRHLVIIIIVPFNIICASLLHCLFCLLMAGCKYAVASAAIAVCLFSGQVVVEWMERVESICVWFPCTLLCTLHWSLKFRWWCWCKKGYTVKRKWRYNNCSCDFSNFINFLLLNMSNNFPSATGLVIYSGKWLLIILKQRIFYWDLCVDKVIYQNILVQVPIIVVWRWEKCVCCWKLVMVWVQVLLA